MNTVTIEAHRFSTFWFWSCLIHALILLLPVRGWISYTPHVTAIELARVEMPILVQQEIKIPQRTPTSKPSMAHKPVASPSVKVVGRATQTIGVRKKDSTGTTLVHKPPVRRRRTAPLPPKVISPAPRSNRVAMVESASPLQLQKCSRGRSQHVMQMKPQAPDAPLQVSRDVEAHSVTISSNAPSVTPAMVRERNASGVMHPRIERLITTERKMYGRSEVKWKQEDTSPIRLLHRKRRGGFSETGEQPQIDIERNHEIIIPSASATSHRGSLIATRKERVGKVKPHPMLNELVGSLAHRAKGGRNKG
ncbi:MAG TPA: hypothetical protein EYP10_10635, partial [Armatimonadetes bacterium]|nr:hypothetical protein [Armatimonadota bacterium]